MKHSIKNSENKGDRAGLYVLGSLYPDVTGGMEIFNYYFLNYQLLESADEIFYITEKKAEKNGGHFVPIKKRWPVRVFYPFQFFMAVFRLRKRISYAYLGYAEQSWIIAFSHGLILTYFNIPYHITIHWGKEPDWKFKYPFVYYFRHAKTVIGVSEPVCIAFKKAIPDQEFQYIPPLIPFCQSSAEKGDIKKRLGYQNEEKLMLYMGSLKGMKNPDRIVEAFHELGPAYLEEKNIRLIMAGTGEMDSELRAKIEQYRLEPFIRMEGLVKRETVPDYYKAADVYMISSDYEGTSLSLLEAMYNGLIIIASDAPGINRMLTHGFNALLYETKNSRALAETIKQVISDPAKAKRLGDNAFIDFNRQYSYDAMIKKYQAVFSSV